MPMPTEWTVVRVDDTFVGSEDGELNDKVIAFGPAQAAEKYAQTKFAEWNYETNPEIWVRPLDRPLSVWRKFTVYVMMDPTFAADEIGD